MIKRLHISGFAVLDGVEIQLDAAPSLIVISGETGSGKSMLLRALRLACGRPDTSPASQLVAPGRSQALIELEWAQDDPNDMGDPENPHTGLVSCMVRESGVRYSSWGRTASRSVVESALSGVVRMVRQGETHLLAGPARQRDWLDEWATSQTAAHGKLLTRMSDAAQHLQTSQTAYRELLELADEQDIQQARLSALLAQVDELDLSDSACEEAFAAQKLVLSCAGQAEILGELAMLLDADANEGMNRVDQLRAQAADLSEELAQHVEVFGSAHAALEQAVQDKLADMPQIDPDQAHGLAGRYRALMTRYGPQMHDVRDRVEDATRRLAKLDDLPHQLKLAKDAEQAAQQQHTQVAEQLHASRGRHAAKLTKGLSATLQVLGVHADVQVLVSAQDLNGPSAHGSDAVRIQLRFATDSPWIGLESVSGGELSRIALALERQRSAHPVMILDEIDTGVGGQTAHKVAQELKELSVHAQVIVVTHLAQIAQQADHHILVQRGSGGASVTQFSASDTQLREAELARMQGLADE